MSLHFYKWSLALTVFLSLAGCTPGSKEMRIDHPHFESLANEFQSRTNAYQWVTDTTITGPAFLFGNDLLMLALQNLSKTKAIAMLDSLLKLYGVHYEALRQNILLSTDILPEAYFVQNLTCTINTLRSAPWADSVSLSDFCEYILPFRVGHESPDNWRDTLYKAYLKLIAEYPRLNHIDSLYKYHMAHSYYYPRAGEEWKKIYPLDMNYSWLRLTKEGECQDRCRYVIYHLRAAGIPATYDYLPNWGNRPFALHAHVGLANRTIQVEKTINNLNNPNDTASNLTSAYMHKLSYVFEPHEMPHGLYVQYVKTIPKVYRQTWSLQPNMTRLYNTIPESDLYTPLVKPNMVDVSDQYLETKDVTITLPSTFRNRKIAYLGVFDLNGWYPVAFAQAGWFGKATFEKLGKNILYMPLIAQNGQMHPFGNPFILMPNGTTKELKVSKDTLIEMKLIRKFPFFSYTAAHAIPFKGCRIEAANKADFSDADTLYTVNNYPFYINQIPIATAKKYRYARMVADQRHTPRVAELAFFGSLNGTETKLTGKPFGYHMPTVRVDRAFDGDYNTYAAGGGLGMDFGQPVQLSRVDFAPCSDTNNILPGNTYDLFYWDKQWVSVGKQTANGYRLVYSKVPSNTVYWLHCHDGGKEERPFTYGENGQVWW
ncbi:MAG: hypothetical protein QM786_02790 [Breznakibacter sp.]